MQRLCAVCVLGNALCDIWTAPLSFSILKKNAQNTEVKEKEKENPILQPWLEGF